MRAGLGSLELQTFVKRERGKEKERRVVGSRLSSLLLSGKSRKPARFSPNPVARESGRELYEKEEPRKKKDGERRKGESGPTG